MPLELANWWLTPLLMTILVGILCPATGTLLITNGRLLHANLISHAVLPGLALALSLGLDPAFGGVLSGLFGALVAERLSRQRVEENEAVINAVLAGFLGLGVLLIPLLGLRIDLEAILFGDLLTVGWGDFGRTLFASFTFLILISFFYREFVFLGVDSEGASANGLPISSMRLALGFVTALVVVSSMAAVGIVLVIGLLCAPALLGLAKAKSLKVAMIRSAGFGVILSTGGFLLAIIFNLPPGPLIGAISLFFLPRWGRGDG